MSSELDAKVAEARSGEVCWGEPLGDPLSAKTKCNKCGRWFSTYRDWHLHAVHNFSTNIAAAWELVEEMASCEDSDETPIRISSGNQKAVCLFARYSTAEWHGGSKLDDNWECRALDGEVTAGGATAQEAICLAYLEWKKDAQD